jgi:branched-chain amino acid transport system ATP-binding protein
MSLLSVKNLCVSYGKVEAVHKLNLEVAQGQIVTVIGPNGAGKSTLLSALAGLLPSTGEIIYSDASLKDIPTEDRVGLGLSLVPEKRELFGEMNVADNLMLGAYHRYRKGDKSIAQSLAEIYQLFPRLQERATQLANTLSGGERQMLALGRALMAKPKLLMLDEPSLGLAPLIVKEIFHSFAQLRANGVSILLVEQNAHAALQVADFGYVLETGEITLQGDSPLLRHNSKVIETYLGLSSGKYLDVAHPT